MNIFLITILILIILVLLYYFIKAINKCNELDIANQKMSTYLNEIIFISKLISKNDGWMKNKNLARIVYTAQKFEKLMITDSTKVNNSNGTENTNPKQ